MIVSEREPSQISSSEINFQARDYSDSKCGQSRRITEPPLIITTDEEELKLCLGEGNIKNSQYLKFPCHSKSVERTVRLVTEASNSVYGEEKRAVFIRERINSRTEIKKFIRKKGWSSNSSYFHGMSSG